MILRPASFDDAPTLAVLGRESFCAAFEHLYLPEDLETFLTQAYSQEVVAGEIAEDAVIHRLAVADEGSRLLGYVKLRAPSPYGEHSDAANPIALGQLYTQPDCTGQGIGAALFVMVLPLLFGYWAFFRIIEMVPANVASLSIVAVPGV